LGLSPNFLSQWKAPEFLVWPTIVCGFFLIGDFGIASEVSWIVFELLMSVYAIQGLSILSAILDLWGIRGWLRVIGYSLTLGLMLPLVLSLGFFDLWFDFRGKFRQS
jgi:cellulose synthase/poly-beta-1,6-N-acetylglucosamine synthase-like glycosyltransferase